MNLKTNLTLLFLSANLFADSTFIEPDNYDNQKHCIVETQEQKYLGLLRFNTTEEFLNKCNGQMIFLYSKDECRLFTMKNMKFDIFIEDKKQKSKFYINETKEVCGKIIIESIK